MFYVYVSSLFEWSLDWLFGLPLNCLFVLYVNELFEKKRVSNLNIIINDFEQNQSLYGYGDYGYGGYGYGGDGYGYYEQEEKG